MSLWWAKQILAVGAKPQAFVRNPPVRPQRRFLCLHWLTEVPVLSPSSLLLLLLLLTPVNCSKTRAHTQAVAVETQMSHAKEAERIPNTRRAERTEEREDASSMDQQQQHAKVERFLKLGYSHSDILRVLDSLRHDAQTNDILEELIKTCHTRAYNDKSSPNSPKLVARGCSPAPSQPRPGPDREPASAFRPVVIDGSNVAMRWVQSLPSCWAFVIIRPNPVKMELNVTTLYAVYWKVALAHYTVGAISIWSPSDHLIKCKVIDNL